MGEQNQNDPQDLLRRIESLEHRLASAIPPGQTITPAAWSLLAVIAACALGFFGIGLPNHYYQILFAALLTGLLYHRQILGLYKGYWRWPLVFFNMALLSLFFKLIIGGGQAQPLNWFKLPGIEKRAQENSSILDKLTPDYELVWKHVEMTSWTINITQIQTVLLLATLLGGLMRFQPFASLTALALLIISIPNFLSYDWDWVILFIVTATVALYLQFTEFAES